MRGKIQQIMTDFRPSFSVNAEEISGERKVTTQVHDKVLYLLPLSKNAYFSIHTNEGPGKWVKPFHAIIVGVHSLVTFCFYGEWRLVDIPLNDAAALLAFTEYDIKYNDEIQSSIINVEETVFYSLLVKDQKVTLQDILLLSKKPAYQESYAGLYHFIRQRESYWIVNYLLSLIVSGNGDAMNNKIQEVSKRYGVSESYFRKLCHRYLKRGAKGQMRIWRAAYCALQLIEGNSSISVIAQDNGYSSSSHFSMEMKSFFGITPKNFRALEGFLYE